MKSYLFLNTPKVNSPKEITKINAEMSALNQENLNNGKGVYWSEGEINAMFVQIDAGDKWIDTPLGIVPAMDIKKGSLVSTQL
jgi:hypothetical protein